MSGLITAVSVGQIGNQPLELPLYDFKEDIEQIYGCSFQDFIKKNKGKLEIIFQIDKEGKYNENWREASDEFLENDFSSKSLGAKRKYCFDNFGNKVLLVCNEQTEYSKTDSLKYFIEQVEEYVQEQQKEEQRKVSERKAEMKVNQKRFDKIKDEINKRLNRY